MMRAEARAERQSQIEAAAYAVLDRKGYDGATMAAIAKQAGASMETLYRWYGDKQGLFKALVTRNAAEVTDRLSRALNDGTDPEDALRSAGPVLLAMLTGDRAVALNRAAAADPGDELGQAIAQAGRDSVVPLIRDTLAALIDAGRLPGMTTGDATALYVDLLVGDIQIRRVVARLPAPDAPTCRARSDRAMDLLLRIAAA